MNTFNESQRLMNEIESLKAQKEEVIQQMKQSSMDALRTEDLRTLINERAVFEEFNPSIFKRVIDRILIDGKQVTFVFNNMMRVTKEIK